MQLDKWIDFFSGFFLGLNEIQICYYPHCWQLANSSMEYDPLYDADKGFKVMPSSFHDISDVEFQDNWGRVWYDVFAFF